MCHMWGELPGLCGVCVCDVCMCVICACVRAFMKRMLTYMYEKNVNIHVCVHYWLISEYVHVCMADGK